MTDSARAPKQWSLTESETITSFESWRANLTYVLNLDSNFAPFLGENASWGRKNTTNPTRGFTADGEDVQAGSRKTAAQKVKCLELMLGQIANYCPVISRHTIVKNSTSLGDVWQAIRLHYGLQSTGAHFLDVISIKPKPEERPETLFQRLMSFVEDSLLRHEGGITHLGEPPAVDEDLSPTLENLITVLWLHLLHEDLPKLVKQRYGTELRTRTVASIRPEISQAIGSLLDELQTGDDARVLRTAAMGFRQGPSRRGTPQPYPRGESSCSTRSCALCQQAGRPGFDTHYLSKCRFLPKQDRDFLVKSRQTVAFDDPNVSVPTADDAYPYHPTDDEYAHCSDSKPAARPIPSRRVNVMQSPYLHAFYAHNPLRLTVDTGAETNMIRTSVAKAIHAPIKKSSQIALQADGFTPMSIAGETKIMLSRNDAQLALEALVVDDLDVDVLAGIPFMVTNDAFIRPAKREIVLSNSELRGCISGSAYLVDWRQPHTGYAIIRYGPFAADSENHTAIFI